MSLPQKGKSHAILGAQMLHLEGCELANASRMVSVDEAMAGVKRLVESKMATIVDNRFFEEFRVCPDYIKSFLNDSPKVIGLARKFLPWRAKEFDAIKIWRELKRACNYDNREHFDPFMLRIYQRISPFSVIEKYSSGTPTGDCFTNWHTFKNVAAREYLLQAISVSCQEHKILESDINDGFSINGLITRVENKVFYENASPIHKDDWWRVEKTLKQMINQLTEGGNTCARICLTVIDNEIAKGKTEIMSHMVLTELRKAVIDEMRYVGYQVEDKKSETK